MVLALECQWQVKVIKSWSRGASAVVSGLEANMEKAAQKIVGLKVWIVFFPKVCPTSGSNSVSKDRDKGSVLSEPGREGQRAWKEQRAGWKDHSQSQEPRGSPGRSKSRPLNLEHLTCGVLWSKGSHIPLHIH